jgi:hypothetical protein
VAVLMVGSLKKGVISFSTVAMIAFQSGHIKAYSEVGRIKGQPIIDAGAEVLAPHEIAIFFD